MGKTTETPICCDSMHERLFCLLETHSFDCSSDVDQAQSLDLNQYLYILDEKISTDSKKVRELYLLTSVGRTGLQTEYMLLGVVVIHIIFIGWGLVLKLNVTFSVLSLKYSQEYSHFNLATLYYVKQS